MWLSHIHLVSRRVYYGTYHDSRSPQLHIMCRSPAWWRDRSLFQLLQQHARAHGQKTLGSRNEVCRMP